MKEIAKLAGMSTMTVSRVLSQKDCCSAKTREKIEAIAAKLGYFPNMLGRSLVLDRLNTIGVVVPNIIQVFFPRVVNAIEETLAKEGFNVFLCCSRDNPEIEAQKIRMLLGHRVAGVIMMPSLRSKLSADSAKMVMKQDCPLVLVDRIIEGIKTDSVGWQSEEAMAKIIEHLVERGCRRIAYVCGAKEEWENRGRTRGFFAAMEANKLKCFAYVNCPNGEDALRGEIKKLFSGKSRPDAICCATDILVNDTLQLLNEMKVKIPEDVALTGFGGIINSHNSKLRITTVEQDAETMGIKAAELILKRIREDGKSQPAKFERVRLPMEVTFCESSMR